ncbi:phage tail protein [Rhizobium sp. VS19-DR104.2]|uniref:phage tail protein n=1 Tax=unclassified Rhizobium TaxID=2613769 RepID=UPI001CC3644B|nr:MULTISPECIES: phage tail protein [unclassified Rhizobium]MBZ5760285.1 phage tail protein [Rhizobium sp. VS19-DR96]MBZ5766871.1 phage tail protein [Rhizobium sp. VS19-DR129.2]MBZ5773136.1 phage tail protein [Rhizobium sp. VS19-DRK62.2]MBZ5784120.1 phage tail protein [Rhizobium sp. VS19-DR121]MBZ5802480.1 phage tail protein [Rhizobium sp. VS19-DR181]
MAFFTSALFVSLGASTFLASVSAFALNAAVGVGISLLAKKLQGDSDTSQTGGVQGTLQAGGDVSRSFILGRRVTAGSLVYANTWGKAGKTPNAYFTQVIALSDLPISDITAIWVNGEPVTVDNDNTSYGNWGYPVTEYSNGSDNSMWVKFYDGTQTVADPFLVGTVSSAGRPYQATRVGAGVAYAIVTSEVNEELFTGFPTFKFEIAGAKLYDVSKDSSVGGSGPQRWAVPSTWGGDGDHLPAVQIYNLLRGFTYGNAWLYGLQSLTAARLPAEDWIFQINKCRAAIAGAAGPEATYLTSLEVTVDTEIDATIQSLLTGCQGRLIESGGTYKLRVGEPGAPVYQFSDADIISTEEQSFTPFFGLSETINGVSATYPEPDEAWNTKTAPPLFNADYEVEDGARRLLTNVTMDMVYRATQVQRIMKSALAEARRARRQTFVLPPEAWVLEPGDVVTFTSNRNGFGAKLFRVDGVADHANLDVTIDLTEVDPTDYDWDINNDYTPPVFSPLGPVRPPAQPMFGWQVEPAVLYDADGVPWRPSIKVSADPTQPDVRNVWVQVRLAIDGSLHFDSDSTVYADPYSWVINANFKGNTQYEARGKFIPISGRATEWSEWLPVTTPNVASDDLLVDLAHTKKDILKVFSDIFGQLNDNRSLVEQIAVNQMSNGAVSDQINRQLAVAVDNNKATFDETVSVIADDINAAVTQIIDLNAEVDANKADANTQIAVVASTANAAAAATQTLSATVGQNFANGQVRFSVAANQNGAVARYSIAIRAGTSSAYVESGMFIEIYDAGGGNLRSRFSVLADQFSVLNPDGSGNSYLPMVFEGGVLKLALANIGNVTAGILHDAANHMVIDLANANIIISD